MFEHGIIYVFCGKFIQINYMIAHKQRSKLTIHSVYQIIYTTNNYMLSSPTINAWLESCKQLYKPYTYLLVDHRQRQRFVSAPARWINIAWSLWKHLTCISISAISTSYIYILNLPHWIWFNTKLSMCSAPHN